jgi:predicted nucleic acid-binding protein
VNLVVDTSVWSRVLRRARIDEADPHVMAFRRHVESGDALFLVGSVLQELLDGLRDPRDADRLDRALTPFPLVPLERATYVQAAAIRRESVAVDIDNVDIDGSHNDNLARSHSGESLQLNHRAHLGRYVPQNSIASTSDSSASPQNASR